MHVRNVAETNLPSSAASDGEAQNDRRPVRLQPARAQSAASASMRQRQPAVPWSEASVNCCYVFALVCRSCHEKG